MNKCIFLGNLVKDPTPKAASTGNLITEVVLAIGRDYKDKETGEYKTDFLRFKAFAKTADYIQTNFVKGDLLQIDAKYQTDTYEVDGETKYSNNFIIDKIKRVRRATFTEGN